MGKITRVKSSYLDNISKLGVFASFLVITVFSVYLYSPVIKSHASGKSERITTVAFDNPEHVDISFDKDMLEIIGRSGTFVSDTVDVRVSTNSMFGYSLALTDMDLNTSLMYENSNISAKISSDFADSKTSTEMDVNTWGFSLDNTNYYKIPEAGMPTLVGSSNTISPEDPGYNSNPVTFGVKIGNNIPSGMYYDEVVFTAFVNGVDGKYPGVYAPGYTIEEKGSMQDFDCETIGINDTIYLTDIRDNNKYEIIRINDGTCWMRQNLRLVNKTITPEDSSVTSDFVVKDSNPEDFVMSSDGNWEIVDGVYYDSANELYGAFYTWNTATAGSAKDIVNNTEIESGTRLETTQSICPKGWRLPNYDDERRLYERYSGHYPIDNLAYAGMIYYKTGSFFHDEIDDYINAWTSYYEKSSNSSLTVYAYYYYYENSSENNMSTSWSRSTYNINDGISIRCVTGSAITTGSGESGGIKGA